MKLRFWRRQGPIDCAQVGRRLQQFLDGELDDERAAAIHEHLEQCLQCGLEADAFEHIKASLAARGPATAEDPALPRLRRFAEALVNGDVDGRG